MIANILIMPVHCDSVFRHLIHLERAYLNLNKLIIQAENGGVQCLVPIRLGVRDKIFDSSILWLPQTMYMSQCYVAIRCGVNENTKSNDIVYLVEICGSFQLFQSLDVA